LRAAEGKSTFFFTSSSGQKGHHVGPAVPLHAVCLRDLQKLFNQQPKHGTRTTRGAAVLATAQEIPPGRRVQKRERSIQEESTFHDKKNSFKLDP